VRRDARLALVYAAGTLLALVLFAYLAPHLPPLME
jgi:hypothetical protein